jgi:catechol 2,3-dioxygenase-like lactoylglutathione lyase family enzyme
MLPVSDVPRAIAFYEQLGFRIGNTHAPETGAAPVWAWLYCGDAHVMINQADGPVDATHSSAAVWLYCADVQAAHAQLAARGLEVGDVSYPFYNPRGEFHVHDPDGYAIFIAHSGQE